MANDIGDIEDPLLASWLNRTEQARSEIPTDEPTTLVQAINVGGKLSGTRLHYPYCHPCIENALILDAHLNAAGAIDPRGNPEIKKVQAAILWHMTKRLRRTWEMIMEDPKKAALNPY
ncbi:hypothetical protein KKC44_04270 [Patescibacteria group bacterium]|nr:hypothetical protein [Patescibacteria group bacterium]MBU2259794.1 hypothetical protein [Patescibacteria group bacterium]